MPDFQTSDGVRLAYDDRGEGPVVLCLAGLTRNMGDFDYVLPHLEGHRVVRMDYRGRGASDWADPSTYAIPVEARDAVELLSHLGISRAAILGTSRGGLIAMALAASPAKGLLSGVCLNDIGPELSAQGLSEITSYVGKPPVEKTLADAVEMRMTQLPGFSGVPRSRWEAEVARNYRETPDGLELAYDPRLAESFGDGELPDLWPLFDALDGLPLALIRGENSSLLAVETADEMARRRPDMIRAEVPNRGHCPFLDEPEALAAIRTWLGRLE